MYYMVGLGKTGQAFLKHHKAFVWDDTLTTSHYPLTPPAAVPWHTLQALVLSPGIPHLYPHAHEAALLAQKYNVPIVCDIDVFLKTHPDLFYMGVTGTNGKSTVTALIHHILNHTHQASLMGGNIGTPVFDLIPKTSQDYCVLELSSYHLERLPTWPTKKCIAILTNITPDHLNRHKDMNGYIKAKEIILKAPIVFMGIDTDPTRHLYETHKAHHPCLVPVSIKEFLSYGLCVRENILYQNGRPCFDVGSLPGFHHAQNIALAFGAMNHVGVRENDIYNALKTFKGLVHRLEWVGSFCNIEFVNDSKATNIDAALGALAAYDHLFWIVGGQPKANELDGVEAYYPKIKAAYTIGEATQRFAKLLSPHVPTRPCYTLDKAVSYAIKDAKALGYGTVLLAPAAASLDQYAHFEARGDHFKTLIREHVKS